jgi:hypothetical protein
MIPIDFKAPNRPCAPMSNAHAVGPDALRTQHEIRANSGGSAGIGKLLASP